MTALCFYILFCAHAHLRNDASGVEFTVLTHLVKEDSLGATESCSAAGRNGEPTVLTVPGTCSDFLWGMEHFPIIEHAAKNALGHGGQCVYVEAGAHKGSLAILAAKKGCTVYAFEMTAANVADMKSAMKLNGIDGNQVHAFEMAIGDKQGSRVDEFVPKGTKVTVLKMDIDGVDALAMRGAKGLFGAGAGDGGVDVINIEFSPNKQERASDVSSMDYLTSLADMGYSVYLSDCYGRTTALLRGLGLTCMSDERGGNGRDSHWVETESEDLFFTCLLEGCADRAAADKNRVDPSHFSKLIEAAKGVELDLVLVKQPPQAKSD